MKVTLITAIGKNGEIGLNNQLLWKSPSDLARFKELTEGYPIIMGRNTFESLPGILPNRTHFVITSEPDEIDLNDIETENMFNEIGSFQFGVNSLEEAINECDGYGDEQVFIIGGASIYKQALEQNLVDEMLITHMNWEGQADKFFRPDLSNWRYVDTIASYSGKVGPAWSQKQYIKGNL